MKKKILIPIDGSERSLDSIKLVKELYTPEEAEIYLLMIIENLEEILTKIECEETRIKYQSMLDKEIKNLEKYETVSHIGMGNAGSEILSYASANNIDFIVMTRSTKKGLARILGSVTAFVVKNSPIVVIVVPESKNV